MPQLLLFLQRNVWKDKITLREFAYRFSWDKKVRRAWKHTAFEFSKYLDPSTYFIMYSKYIILILSHSDRMTYLHLDNVDIKGISYILSHEPNFRNGRSLIEYYPTVKRLTSLSLNIEAKYYKFSLSEHIF